MALRKTLLFISATLLIIPLGTSQTCAGKPQPLGGKSGWALDGGGFAMFSKMNVNIDGYAKAYHPDNAAAGALLHLCVAGKVYLPDGTSYEGSESNQTCTGKFMTDFAKIRAAGWQDPSVGAINWYGIVGQGSATIHGRTITAVKPVEQKDGSGFYVSPTSLFDHSVRDEGDQDRYVNPLRIPAAVVPRVLQSKGIVMGTFGVAIDKKKNIAVPFVVDDSGPAVGEGSVALARMVAGQPSPTTSRARTATSGRLTPQPSSGFSSEEKPLPTTTPSPIHSLPERRTPTNNGAETSVSSSACQQCQPTEPQ
jgi:hypothetical protein